MRVEHSFMFVKILRFVGVLANLGYAIGHSYRSIKWLQGNGVENRFYFFV